MVCPTNNKERSEEKELPLFWKKLQILCTATAAVLIPIAIVVVGHFVNSTIKNNEIRLKYVELAVSILKEKPNPETANLRKWAIDIVNVNSNVKLSKAAEKELQKQKLIFSDQSQVNLDTKKLLEISFDGFQVYVQKLGFRPEHQQIGIEVRDIEGTAAYYDDEKRLMVIDSKYADDPDFMYREYMLYVLYHKDSHRYDSMNFWPYYAVGSGLASYFPCSYNGRPVFGGKTTEGTGFWNIGKIIYRLNEIDSQNVVTVGGLAWSNAFWEIRNLLGQVITDELLFESWFNFRPDEVLQNGKFAFGKKLIERIKKINDGRFVPEVKEILRARGMPI